MPAVNPITILLQNILLYYNAVLWKNNYKVDLFHFVELVIHICFSC